MGYRKRIVFQAFHGGKIMARAFSDKYPNRTPSALRDGLPAAIAANSPAVNLSSQGTAAGAFSNIAGCAIGRTPSHTEGGVVARLMCPPSRLLELRAA